MITEKRVEDFIEENMSNIISDIAASVDTEKSTYEYTNFDGDDFEVLDMNIKGNKCYVLAESYLFIGYLNMLQDGAWPDEKKEKVEFTIIVEEDSEGNLKYILPRTEDGKVDDLALLSSTCE